MSRIVFFFRLQHFLCIFINGAKNSGAHHMPVGHAYDADVPDSMAGAPG